MNAIVIAHALVSELPSAWRAKLAQSPNARVTVRIGEEPQSDVRVERADLQAFDRIMARAGGQPPREGDER